MKLYKPRARAPNPRNKANLCCQQTKQTNKQTNKQTAASFFIWWSAHAHKLPAHETTPVILSGHFPLSAGVTVRTALPGASGRVYASARRARRAESPPSYFVAKIHFRDGPCRRRPWSCGVARSPASKAEIHLRSHRKMSTQSGSSHASSYASSWPPWFEERSDRVHLWGRTSCGGYGQCRKEILRSEGHKPRGGRKRQRRIRIIIYHCGFQQFAPVSVRPSTNVLLPFSASSARFRRASSSS